MDAYFRRSSSLPPLALSLFSSAATLLVVLLVQKRHLFLSSSSTLDDDDDDGGGETKAGWLQGLYADKNLESVDEKYYPEWCDQTHRSSAGFLGSDLIHSRKTLGPRILKYFHDKSTNTLLGACVFGPAGESHAGYCHGGSMCSVLDDVCGHAAFVCGGCGPWAGCTVQVNCTLKKPVKIGQVLKVWGRVKERKGRKLFIEGALEGEDGLCYATLDGIALQVSREQLFGTAPIAAVSK